MQYNTKQYSTIQLKHPLYIQLNPYATPSLTVTFAKFLTFSRTTLIPRSSDALSSKIRDLKSTGPKRERAKAKMVEVFPVPGGP